MGENLRFLGQLAQKPLRILAILLGISAGLGIFSTSSWAYPHFVAYGYTSCSVCHYNPLGNGPLTDYGRALGANEFSSKSFWSKAGTTDEEIAATSSFWGGKGGGWFNPSINYRGLGMVTTDGSNTDTRWINMLADFNLVLGKPDSFFISGTIGYFPASSGGETWISREHYIGMRFSKRNGLYAGFMDTAFGTRLPDHTAFSRENGGLGLGQNDQTHGIMFHHAEPKMEWAIHGFAGNLYQDADVRQMGGSTVIEYEPAPKVRLGTSLLYSQSKIRKRAGFALHSRQGLENGAGLLNEIGMSWNKVEGSDANLAVYSTNQAFLRLKRGLHLLLTFEYLTSAVTGSRSHRIQTGPGLIYSPMQRIEFRTEIMGYRTFHGTPGASTPDNISLLGQVHVYL